MQRPRSMSILECRDQDPGEYAYFPKGTGFWGFNIQRRIQRYLEVNRWTAISMDYTLGQTLHAGLIE